MTNAKVRQFRSLLDRIWDQPLLSDELVQNAVELVARTMGTEVATLYAYNFRADELLLVATRGLPRSGVGFVTLKKGDGMSGQAAALLRPVSSSDTRREPDFLPIKAFDQDRYLSLLAVPVLLDEKLVGVLNVQSSEVREYTPREVQELSDMAEVLAPRLDELFRRDLAARVRGPNVLAHMDGFLSTNGDPLEIAQELAKQLQAVFPARSSTVALMTDGETMTLFGDPPDEEARYALERAVGQCSHKPEPKTDVNSGIAMTLCDEHHSYGAFYLGLGEGSSLPLSSAAMRLIGSLAAQVTAALARCNVSKPQAAAPEAHPADAAYGELVDMVLAESGLDVLLERASELCHAQIAVTDAVGTHIAGTMPDFIGANLPLKAGDVTLGRLLASRPPEAASGIPAVAKAATMELLKWKIRFDVERDLRGDALDSLLSLAGSREAISRAALLGVDPERTYVPVLFELDMNDLVAKRGSIVLRAITSTIQRAFGAAPHGVLFVRPEGILVLADVTKQRRGALPLVAEVLTSLRSTVPGASISAGIGPAAAGPPDYASAIKQARLAADLGARLDAHLPIDASEIGTYRLLVGVEDNRLLSEFVNEYLGVLIEHDMRRGTDFIRTLEAYHSCGEKLRPTAEALFIHVNTLKHRLSRIAELTGRDLDSVADRFNMELALYALRLLKPDAKSLLPTFIATASTA